MTHATATRTRPWVSGADGVWVIGWDEAVLLAGPDDEPDDRDDTELVSVLDEAGVTNPDDQALVLALHRESIWGVHAVGYET